jgi:D-sedoheptulose 7-phosphate isomerase
MNDKSFLVKYFDLLINNLYSSNYNDLVNTADLILESASKNGKIIIAGNGGSAAMASHVSVDLTKAAGIRAINFNEADLITCFANDYGYENWITKALEFYIEKFDLVILISSSGQSKNLLNAACWLKSQNVPFVTLTGFEKTNPLHSSGGDVNFWVDSKSYNIVEMTHHIWLLSIVDLLIERKIYK